MDTKKIYYFLLILLFTIAFVLRILFYFYGRPFWNDECALALNIVNIKNYFGPLEYGQCAPALFMYISKIFYHIIFPKEYALRLLPLLSSILSLFAFRFLGEKFFKKKSSFLISFTIFTFCYPVCYYAQEFKQYSSDILCFLILLCSYFVIDKINSKKKIVILMFIYALSLWFSYAAGIALFSVLTTSFIFKRKFLNKYYIPSIFVIISLIIFIFMTRNIQTNESLHTYWIDGFINRDFSNFINLITFNIQYIFNSIVPLFLLSITIIIHIAKERKNDLYMLLTMPIILSLILSYLKIYPFSKRVTLFLIPLFIIIIIKPFDYINLKNKIVNNIILSIVAFIVTIPVFSLSVRNIIFKQYVSEDIITPLKIALQNIEPNDIIYIADNSKILYEYYKDQFIINNKVIIDEKYYLDEQEYEKHLNNLPANTTYYWVFAHHKNKFIRLKTVYIWAKNKPNFKIYTDNKGNGLIKFTNL